MIAYLKNIKSSLSKNRFPLLIALSVGLLSCCITYNLWRSEQQVVRGDLQNEFDFRARETVNQIVDRMDTYRQVLRGVKGQLHGSIDIEREKFRFYAESLRLDEEYPGIQGIAISKIIPKEKVDEHVSSIRQEGFPNYSIVPGGEREVYTAITHIEPFSVMNKRAFGFDMFHEPVRRAAMEQSRDIGRAALSGKVVLVQEGKIEQYPGFLMYLPVYKLGMPINTVEERRQNILGWVYAPFRIQDFMTGLGGERFNDLIVKIYDGKQASAQSCLFGCTEIMPQSTFYKKTIHIDVVRHPWTIEIQSTPAFENRLNSGRAQIIGITGLGISFLLTFLVWLLASGRNRALSLATQMTRELSSSEFRWKFALEGAGDGVWDWNIQTGEVVYSNRWKSMLDYEEHEVSNQFSEWERLAHPEDKSQVLAAVQNYIAGKTPTYSAEHRLRCKDGSWKWVHTRGMIVSRDDQGNPLRFIGTHTDITERKQLEERETERQSALEEARAALQQAQKLEAVGKLTGGVAHDFNNLLQVIQGNVQLLQYGSGNQEKRLTGILAAVERGTKLSSQLLAFARRQPLQPQVINIRHLVRNLDDMLRRAIGEAIQIETIMSAGLWNTLVDPNQLENVILNLAINARDAMKEGGKLTIELDNAMLNDEYVRFQPDVPAGQYVVVAVSDTGTGIPPAVLERVFEPFFTTKPEGEGTGLGLSMAYGFVKQSGGHIRIYSEIGHGTTVRIYLPRSFENEEIIPTSDNAPIVGGSETILVVEDDVAVQATVVSLLEELGYHVLKANDAESAYGIVKRSKKIDLLFTDVVMPGTMRSPELARKAKEVFPNLAVLFTSGYTQNAIVHGGRLDPGVNLLSKPYRREQLARKVRHVIANQQQLALLQQLPVVNSSEQEEQGKGQWILVVEDNNDLRQLACEVLMTMGFKTYSVPSAEEALSAVAKMHYDILFTDVGLPGMSGIELAEEVAKTQADIKIIFATGYGDVLPNDVEMRATILKKPYNLAQIKDTFDAVYTH